VESEAAGGYGVRVAKGIEGEEIVGAELERRLAGTGAAVDHSIQFMVWGDIDHLIIGPGGITVVDAKYWSGQVSVRGRVPYIGAWRKARELQKLVGQCAGVRLALKSARAELRGTEVQGLMCMAAEPDRLPEPLKEGLRLCGSHAAATIGARPGPLLPADVEHLRSTLVRQLPRIRRADVDAVLTPPVPPAPQSPAGTVPHPSPARRVGRPFGRPRRARRVARSRFPRRIAIAIALLVVIGGIARLGQPAPPTVSYLHVARARGRAVVRFSAPAGQLVEISLTGDGPRRRTRRKADGHRQEWIAGRIGRRTHRLAVEACLIDSTGRCAARAVRATLR
jgi:hypothetical protein